MKLSYIKRFFTLPEEKRQYLPEIEKKLSDDASHVYQVMSCIIMIMQLMMIVLFAFFKKGGPFSSPRRTGYFLCYLILFLITFAFLLYFRASRRFPRLNLSILSLGAAFSFFICLWACAVTALDQFGGNGLIVYCYMLPTVAALSILRPRQSIFMFGVSCILLNIVLICLPDGYHNLFSNIINSVFITLISMFISISTYFSKYEAHYNRLIIEQQYEEICSMFMQLNQLAITDQLTQLYNRRYLEETVAHNLSSVELAGRAVAGMMIDIDFFKEYNDRYGHQAGDRCLQAIAKVLLECAENTNASIVRYGGEEFFLCLFDCSEDTAMETAESIRQSICACNFSHAARSSPDITVSIGVCYCSPNMVGSISLSSIVSKADLALYQAKKQGRNRCVLYDPEM